MSTTAFSLKHWAQARGLFYERHRPWTGDVPCQRGLLAQDGDRLVVVIVVDDDPTTWLIVKAFARRGTPRVIGFAAGLLAYEFDGRAVDHVALLMQPCKKAGPSASAIRARAAWQAQTKANNDTLTKKENDENGNE
jgi:hypothetical protein